MDTIFALSTPPGRGGVGVVRISGPSALKVLELFGTGPVEPRKAALRELVLGGEVIDKAIILRFSEGASFTGEEVLELHLHGSPSIIRRVLGALSEQPEMRQAEPGEFTRRALENDRMDLAEVEGLGALIEAETEAQRRLAQRIFAGELGRLCEGWREDLLRAVALVEVTIDFVDEEVPVDVAPEVTGRVSRVRDALAREVAGSFISERIREGFEVAIVGAPNAGKSTLLNALAGRPAALTSEVAGTTRDVIEVRMDLGGLAVTLLDTAGLRESDDPVETMGVALAVSRAAAADLRVFLLSSDEAEDMVGFMPGDIKMWGKADVDPRGEVSGLTGQGIDVLVGRIGDELKDRASGAAVATHERHRIWMAQAKEALDLALAVLEDEPEHVELAAEHLRVALRSLDGLIGRVDVEQVLGEIFARFCIGK